MIPSSRFFREVLREGAREREGPDPVESRSFCSGHIFDIANMSGPAEDFLEGGGKIMIGQ